MRVGVVLLATDSRDTVYASVDGSSNVGDSGAARIGGDASGAGAGGGASVVVVMAAGMLEVVVMLAASVAVTSVAVVAAMIADATVVVFVLYCLVLGGGGGGDSGKLGSGGDGSSGSCCSVDGSGGGGSGGCGKVNGGTRLDDNLRGHSIMLGLMILLTYCFRLPLHSYAGRTLSCRHRPGSSSAAIRFSLSRVISLIHST